MQFHHNIVPTSHLTEVFPAPSPPSPWAESTGFGVGQKLGASSSCSSPSTGTKIAATELNPNAPSKTLHAPWLTLGVPYHEVLGNLLDPPDPHPASRLFWVPRRLTSTWNFNWALFLTGFCSDWAKRGAGGRQESAERYWGIYFLDSACRAGNCQWLSPSEARLSNQLPASPSPVLGSSLHDPSLPLWVCGGLSLPFYDGQWAPLCLAGFSQLQSHLVHGPFINLSSVALPEWTTWWLSGCRLGRE